MANKTFQHFQQALFGRAAKNMSSELQRDRDYYVAHRPRRFRRACDYCMHEQYNYLLRTLTYWLNE